jgi:hypothetical protein
MSRLSLGGTADRSLTSMAFLCTGGYTNELDQMVNQHPAERHILKEDSLSFSYVAAIFASG